MKKEDRYKEKGGEGAGVKEGRERDREKEFKDASYHFSELTIYQAYHVPVYHIQGFMCTKSCWVNSTDDPF